MQGIRAPEQASMTLAEFLENNIEGYEYVKGALVPMSPAPRIYSKISVKFIRHLDRHVHEDTCRGNFAPLTRKDTLTDADVVPGFACPVARFFE